MAEENKPPISPERVELSGWDISGEFFRENDRLIGLNDGQLFTELGHKLRVGALVFARPLDWMEKPEDLPVVYQVTAVERGGAHSPGGVRLAVFKPARAVALLARMPS